jgi:hypothetical protein
MFYYIRCHQIVIYKKIRGAANLLSIYSIQLSDMSEWNKSSVSEHEKIRTTFVYDSVSQPVCRYAQMCHQFIPGVPPNLKMAMIVCKNSHIFLILAYFTLRCTANFVFKINVPQAQKG